MYEDRLARVERKVDRAIELLLLSLAKEDAMADELQPIGDALTNLEAIDANLLTVIGTVNANTQTTDANVQKLVQAIQGGASPAEIAQLATRVGALSASHATAIAELNADAQTLSADSTAGQAAPTPAPAGGSSAPAGGSSAPAGGATEVPAGSSGV